MGKNRGRPEMVRAPPSVAGGGRSAPARGECEEGEAGGEGEESAEGEEGRT